ncbi:MAG: molybdopterin molybdotransferase MoeA [Nitrospirae bacterium]|nr:molybdopterin molybdotransferase MoeA [Nitrospirota bacterium]
MLGREEVLTEKDARELLLKSIESVHLKEAEIEIENSLNRILSRDILSPEDLPSFTRSTVDGFAVRAENTFGATEAMPAYLNISHEILMGEETAFELKAGDAAKIATGGMLPVGSDAVVMFEHCQSIDDKMIEVLKPAAPGENVIHAGEDCKKGDTILTKGHCIRPQDIGALAGLGIIKIWAYEKPKVAIISTGDEVVPLNAPLKPGQVRDINSYNLSGLIELQGGIPVKKGIFPDNYDVLKKVLEESFSEADIIIISGGSSVGTKDLTARLINELGPPGVLFHGVSIKPGKPMIGAIVEGKPVLGLPGHPAAVTVCFELFIKPVLKILAGQKRDSLQGLKKTVRARLSRNISSGSGRQEYVRVMLEERGSEIWAAPVFGKSGLITTLIKAQGTIVITLNKTGLSEGEEVEVELF